MANTFRQSPETQELTLLQTVTTVYGEIAAMWMKRARDSILDSRNFVDEIQHIFLTVFALYAEEIKKLARKQRGKRKNQITFLAHNGKDVAVFISANTGFYGDIIRQTFEQFLQDVRETNAEAVILGKQGLSMYIAEEPKRPYTHFEFSDEHINQEQLLGLVRHLVQYEQVRIYHGKFQTFLNQVATRDLIAADPYKWMEESKTKPAPHIFEPNIDQVLMFFEKQVFTSVLEQSVREAQLAKFASRIMVMDRAGENIRQRLKKVHNDYLKSAHRINNQKQLNQYASLRLWYG